ncbi:hypothetical protein RKD49_000214 [Streptomyces glaucescens]|jgi:hypothetical protein
MQWVTRGKLAMQFKLQVVHAAVGHPPRGGQEGRIIRHVLHRSILAEPTVVTLIG